MTRLALFSDSLGRVDYLKNHQVPVIEELSTDIREMIGAIDIESAEMANKKLNGLQIPYKLELGSRGLRHFRFFEGTSEKGTPAVFGLFFIDPTNLFTSETQLHTLKELLVNALTFENDERFKVMLDGDLINDYFSTDLEALNFPYGVSIDGGIKYAMFVTLVTELPS